MPTTHRITALVTALVAVGGLVGCANESPQPSAAPDPTSAPVFASEEEALAAATDAYQKYQEMSDLILAEGGADPDRIDALTSGDAREAARGAFSSFAQDGYRISGRSELTNVVLERVERSGDADGEIAIYVCLNVAKVDVLDRSGASVVTPERPASQAFEASFAFSEGGELKLTMRDAWYGGGVCE